MEPLSLQNPHPTPLSPAQAPITSLPTPPSTVAGSAPSPVAPSRSRSPNRSQSSPPGLRQISRKRALDTDSDNPDTPSSKKSRALLFKKGRPQPSKSKGPRPEILQASAEFKLAKAPNSKPQKGFAFYSIAQGFDTGIYLAQRNRYKEVIEPLVSGYPNAVFASFNSWLDAKEFYEEKDGPPLSDAVEESAGHIPIVISSSLSALPVPPSLASPSLISAHSNIGNSSLVPCKPSPGLSLQASPGLSGLTRSRPNKADDGNTVSTLRNALAVSSNVLVTSSSSSSTPTSDYNMSLLNTSTKHNLVDACNISTASSSDSVSVSSPLGTSTSPKPSAPTACSTAVSGSDKVASPPNMSSATSPSVPNIVVGSSCSQPSVPADIIARIQQLINERPSHVANPECLEKHIDSLHSCLLDVLDACGATNRSVRPPKPNEAAGSISAESSICRELEDNSHLLEILSSHPGFYLPPADTKRLTVVQAEAYSKLGRSATSREDPFTILEVVLGQAGAVFSMVQKMHLIDLVARVTQGQGDCGTLALVTSATGQSDPPTELAGRRALARHVKQALDSGRAADLSPFGFDGQFATPGDFIVWESRITNPTGNLEASDLMLMGELMGVHVGIFNASSNVDGPANSPDNLCSVRGFKPNVYLLYEPPGKGGSVGHYSSVSLHKPRAVVSVQDIRANLTSLGCPPHTPSPAAPLASAPGAVLTHCKGSMSTLDPNLHHIRTLLAAENRKRASAGRTSKSGGDKSKVKVSPVRKVQGAPAIIKSLSAHAPPHGQVPAPTEEQSVRMCNFVRSGQSCPYLQRFGACKFAHNPSSEACRQFQSRGACEYGMGCRYTHSFSPPASTSPRLLASSNPVTRAPAAHLSVPAQVPRPRLHPPSIPLINGRRLEGSWASGPPLSQSRASAPPLLQSRADARSQPPMVWHLQPKPCHFYSKGNCYFGDTCKFSHVGPPPTH